MQARRRSLGCWIWLRSLAGLWLVHSAAAANLPCADPALPGRLLAVAQAAAHAAPSQLEQRWNEVLAAAQQCGLSEQELDAWQRRTEALRQGATVATAQASAQQWRRRAAELGAGLSQARAELASGRLYVLSGDIALADRALESARQLFEQFGSTEERARMFSELSRLERRRSNYLEALRHEQVALRLRSQSDPEGREAWRSLQNLAVLYEQVELFDEARVHYAQSLSGVEQFGTPREQATVLASYAGFLNDFGGRDSAQALQMAERALGLQRSFGDPVATASALLQVGRARFAARELAAAAAAYEEAYGLARAGGASSLLAHLNFRWGELDLERGRLTEALARVEQARDAYEQQQNRHRLIKVYALLERLHLQRGDALAAAQSGREHYRLRNELLGAGASGKLGELLTNYALTEERSRNELLREENASVEQSLSIERRAQIYTVAFALLLAAVLAVLTWRHRQARRLNALLRQQSAEIESRRTELAQAHERLKAQSAQLYQASITDSLTGLRNRTYALNGLRELLHGARAQGRKPVVMMFDIDHFKQINDQYGHLVGDRTLEKIAETLLLHAAPEALCARLGGEEFLYVIADADRASAHFQAELLRRKLCELRVEHDQGVLAISASIGVCCVEDLSEPTVQRALRSADQAMYQAKAAGRNCVRMA